MEDERVDAAHCLGLGDLGFGGLGNEFPLLRGNSADRLDQHRFRNLLTSGVFRI